MKPESDLPDDLKALLGEPPRQPFDPDLSLRRVLVSARRQTSARDILGFFFSWIWVLFAGFGASLHQAHTRLQLQRAQQARLRRPSTGSGDLNP
jgi:hypothetical protein